MTTPHGDEDRRVRLTRRDAVVALGAIGIGAYGVGQVLDPSDGPDPVATLLAVTDLVYPPGVAVDEAFLETYVIGRTRAHPAYDEHLSEAVSALDRQARQDFGTRFADLRRPRRRRVLRRLGVARVQATPDGTLGQRIRYVVVNDLLYALYATPVGGRLLGLENPPGHPGGREAYTRGPREEQ
jgi:hypothetical protein